MGEQTPLQREGADSDASPDDDAEADLAQRLPQRIPVAGGEEGGAVGGGPEMVGDLLYRGEGGERPEMVGGLLDLDLGHHAFPIVVSVVIICRVC